MPSYRYMTDAVPVPPYRLKNHRRELNARHDSKSLRDDPVLATNDFAGPVMEVVEFHCSSEYVELAGMSPPPIQKLVP